MAMFYADAILSKKGPLARVWLAAHYERKLSKAQTLQTDIGQSAKAIESRPLALRISGQLLLGVCRIYSRKAKYLLDDCNEALVKIKLAFRPGLVDLPPDQTIAPTTSITLPTNLSDLPLDLLTQPWDLPTPPHSPTLNGKSKHLAHSGDINLPEGGDFLMTLGEEEWDLGEGGFGDLDLNFGENVFVSGEDGIEEDSMAIELGRDAPNPRQPRDSLASDLKLRGEQSFVTTADGLEAGAFDMDLDLGNMGDLNLDFGDAAAAVNVDEEGTRQSSLLTEQPPTTPKDVTNELPTEEAIQPTKNARKPRQPKVHKPILDSKTEATVKQDLSTILCEPQYLPSSLTHARLLEVYADPLAHFLPSKVDDDGSIWYGGRPGLGEELRSLFWFKAGTDASAGHKRKHGKDGDRPGKRQRTTDPDDIEMLRDRASEQPFSPGRLAGGEALEVADESGFLPDASLPMDDFRLELDDSLHLGDAPSQQLEENSLSRHTTPGFEYAEGGEDSLVRVFELQIQTQAQDISALQVEGVEGGEGGNATGFSRNTVQAISLLRSELEGQEKSPLSFKKLTDKGSRRAASSFFFELLLLGTRDCVKLEQSKAFGDIKVRAKGGLWEGRVEGERLIR